MVEFLFLLLSYLHLSVSKYGDIVNKFKLCTVDLIHCYDHKLSGFQLEGTLRTTGTPVTFNLHFANYTLLPPKGKEKKNLAFPWL